MDLKMYYEKVRETKAKIASEYVVVASLETPDGGKAGVLTEVPRALAARMFVDGLAEPVAPAVADQFRKAQADAKRRVDDAIAAAKLTFEVVKSSARTEK